jgi:hypothetical protein
MYGAILGDIFGSIPLRRSTVQWYPSPEQPLTEAEGPAHLSAAEP